MIVVGSILLGALLILGFWASLLWLFARADRKYLERERLERIFGEGSDG